MPLGGGGEDKLATSDEVDASEAAQAIRDLLAIAKVAMPDDLYAADPRIIKAEALLARLEGRLS